MKTVFMKKYALCLITNTLYSDGVCVGIYSFLEHNKWFDGDIVIIDYGFIDERARKKMQAMYDKLYFKKADDPRYDVMWNKVKKLQDEELKKPDPRSIYAFPYIYKIEAFGLEGYERVVFFDSDLVVFGDVRYLFENDYDFAVCRDLWGENYTLPEDWRKPGDLINSGVMSIKSPSKELFDEIMNEALNFEKDEIYLGLCYEQDSICKFFDKKKVRLLSFEYNFPQVLFVYRDFKITTQKIVHYYGPFKPWKTDDPRAEYINSFYHKILTLVNKKYTGKKAKLVFHLYCKSKNDISLETESKSNKLHRLILSKYSCFFDEALFCVSVDDLKDSETVSEAVKWIMSCGFENNLQIKVVKNDELREARTFFNEIVNKLEDENNIVMFSHNKGCTHGLESESLNETVAKWTAFSYFSIFRNFAKRFIDVSEYGICCGYVPVHGAVTPWNYSTLNKYGWHTPGTILLINPKSVSEHIKSKQVPLPNAENYLSAEMFFGNIFDITKNSNDYCVFFEDMPNRFFETKNFNPYEVPHSELIRYFLPEDIAKEYDYFFEDMANKL